MDIKIPDSWLRDYLTTKAKPAQIAEYLSLCGPSVEKVEKDGKDFVYDIEVTTNRSDSTSVYGIAREAAAILPRFKIAASLKPLKPITATRAPGNPLPLTIKCNIPEVRRVMAVVIDNVSSNNSPDWLKRRLEMSGLRSLNLLIDITNYVMLETGHPTHVFDYDRIKSHELVFRKSDKGEKVTSLEKKTYSLPGNDIVIDNGEGEIIDLPGIIGTVNSVVTADTKRIIFFIDNNDPAHMRKTSMSLAIRTMAVTINEKDVDPELASLAFARGIELYKELAKGRIASKVIDIYPSPYKNKTTKTNLAFINKRLGINIDKNEITEILDSLGFKTKWTEENQKTGINNLEVSIPSYRAHDIDIPEDIVEEVARVYGYHNLPSSIMTGIIPDSLTDAPFDFETKIKGILQNSGGIEVYTLSLVSKDKAGDDNALKLKNPLGNDTEYLRTSLAPSLTEAVKQNKSIDAPFQLFEMANVYSPKKDSLPEEVMMVAGIFSKSDFRVAKGIVENLLFELNISAEFVQGESQWFITNHHLSIKTGETKIGQFGVLKEELIYYELDVEKLRGASRPKSFKPLSKYPPQVEDMSVVLPAGVIVGEVIQTIKKVDSKIDRVELTNLYEDTKTLRITYLDASKTLTDTDVSKIRARIIKALETKFGARIK